MTTSAAVRVAMVRPPRGIVGRGVAPVRAKPDDSSELVDQAGFGELLTRLAEEGGWTYAQGPDLYFGWIRTSVLSTPFDVPELFVVGVPLATLRARPADDAEVVDRLPAGSPIRGGARRGDWLALAPDRHVRLDELVSTNDVPARYPTADDLLATAEAYLGAPYLWGGTTVQGIDCSGLTQQVYRLNGVGLDRDADQQALGGRAVERARPGDLFFFGPERVTHVALATGERSFIHAPQKGGFVERGELSDERRLLAIRRYLP